MSPDDRDREWRAARRRATWDGGVVRAGDAQRFDVEFWRRVSGGDRLQATWELSAEWYGEDESELAGGLRGSAHGVRRR